MNTRGRLKTDDGKYEVWGGIQYKCRVLVDTGYRWIKLYDSNKMTDDMMNDLVPVTTTIRDGRRFFKDTENCITCKYRYAEQEQCPTCRANDYNRWER